MPTAPSPSLSRRGERDRSDVSERIEVRSLAGLEAFAKRFAKGLRGGETVALTGELGAGKTAFVQALGRALGVRERITSPTFTIMHLHGAGLRGKAIRHLAHVDAYRLASAKAFRDIGALDYLGRPDTVSAVEWAERVKRILPHGTVWMRISSAGGERRIIEIARI